MYKNIKINSLVGILFIISILGCSGCSMFEKENELYEPLPLVTTSDLKANFQYWFNQRPKYDKGATHISAHMDVSFVTQQEARGWDRNEIVIKNVDIERRDDNSFKVEFDTNLAGKKRSNELIMHRVGYSDILIPQDEDEDYYFYRHNPKDRKNGYVKFDNVIRMPLKLGGTTIPFLACVEKVIDKNYGLIYYPSYDIALGVLRGKIYNVSVGERSAYIFNNGLGAWADEQVLKERLGLPVIRKGHRFFALNNKKGPDCLEITKVDGAKYMTLWPSAGCEYYAKGDYYDALEEEVKKTRKGSTKIIDFHKKIDNDFCGFKIGESLEKQKVVFLNNDTSTVSKKNMRVSKDTIKFSDFFEGVFDASQVKTATAVFNDDGTELKHVWIEAVANVKPLEEFLNRKLAIYQIHTEPPYSNLWKRYANEKVVYIWSCGDYLICLKHYMGSTNIDMYIIDKKNLPEHWDNVKL